MGKQTLVATTLPFLITPFIACGDDRRSAPEEIVGSYYATQFVTSGSSGQVNQLLSGGSINLRIEANASTSGTLVMANPSRVVDLRGYVTFSGNTLRFSQQHDSYLGQVSFTISTTTADFFGEATLLTADEVISGTRVQITLIENPGVPCTGLCF